jgi:hypothetical protein
MRSFISRFHQDVRLSFSVMERHALLFVGIALFILGLLNFSNGKYCDGNVADYYSCTNTAVYYYYGPIAVIACIVGAFLMTVWHINKISNI